MLPTFFLAGAAKAGTTSLHAYLGEHPGVFMSEVKEPHHFSWEDDGWPRWAVRDRAEYEALFAEARPEQARGESSTWTLYSKGASGRIAEAIPDARFIVLLRNPTDRAFSNWTFNFSLGYDPLPTFEAALAAEPERIAQGAPWHQHYVEAGRYHDQVKRLVDRFGRDRVLVMLFEEFRADTAAAVEQAYRFLDVDPAHQPDFDAVHNKTYMPRSRALHNFLWRSNPVKGVLKAALPSRFSARVGRAIKRRNRTDVPALSRTMRDGLNEVFRDNVEQLSDLLGRDLHAIWLR